MTLHYENMGGMLVRRDGWLQYKCPVCKYSGRSKSVLTRCPKSCDTEGETMGKAKAKVQDDEDESVLSIDSRDAGYQIGWYFEATGEYGLMLGQCGDYDDDSDQDAVESIAAERAAIEVGGFTKSHIDGAFIWESKSRAQKAFAAAKRAMKAARESAESKVPWPEWAIQATAAGWAPPKGWKPTPAE